MTSVENMFAVTNSKIQEYMKKNNNEPNLLILPYFMYDSMIEDNRLTFAKWGLNKNSLYPSIITMFSLRVIPHMGSEIIVLKEYIKGDE